MDYLFCCVAEEHLEAVREVWMGGVGEKEGAGSPGLAPQTSITAPRQAFGQRAMGDCSRLFLIRFLETEQGRISET